jgi:hypothetical protein
MRDITRDGNSLALRDPRYIQCSSGVDGGEACLCQPEFGVTKIER